MYLLQCADTCLKTRHILKSKWENLDIFYPDGEPDHSLNVIGSRLDQDTSSDFFKDGPSRQI